ncbi:MAG: YlbE-like family protein [Turicibacter sp.]|nr:YlbE-like family protein [Turicibacter sp.]
MEIIYQIVNDQEQRDYIRMFPIWYKELNRHPEKYQDFVDELDAFKKMNQPSRLEKIDQQISTAQFLMKLFKK